MKDHVAGCKMTPAKEVQSKCMHCSQSLPCACMYVFYGTRHKKLYKIRGFTVKYHFVEMGDTFHGSSTAILRLAAQKLYGISAEFQQNLSDFVKFLVPCTVRTYLRIYLLLHSCFSWFHTPTHACCRVYTCNCMYDT